MIGQIRKSQAYLVSELKCLVKLKYQSLQIMMTYITDDHFEIKLIARLLDQIYVVQSPQSPPRYGDTPLDPMSFTQTVNNTGSLIASAPMLPLHMPGNPT